MEKRLRLIGVSVMTVVLLTVLSLSLSCASTEPTATPIPPAQPAAPLAPTAAPAPTIAAAPAAPTAVQVQPTATKVIPTSTAVVTGSPQSGGILRHAATLKFDTLDGHLNTFFEMQVVLFIIYDNIVELGPSGEILPGLAESWGFSPDGKSVSFNLRKGVKFHDGTDFNAEAAKWNIDRILDSQTGSAQRAVIGPSIDKVDVIDAYTLSVLLKKPSRPFLSLLADRAGYVLSPTAVGKLGADFGARPVGTGLFKVSKWLLGESNTLEKNANYWEKGKPFLDRVLIQDVPDINVQIAMVRTGETDVVTYITPLVVRLTEGNPNLKVQQLYGQVHGFAMNVSTPPYSSKALRQAIAYSFDAKEILSTYYEGRGQAAYSIIAPGSWAYNPDIVVYKYDLQKAKEKLAEAGLTSSATVPVWCGSAASDVLRCEVFQAQLKKAGINVELKVVPQADYFASFRRDWRGERTLAGYSFWSPRGDPSQGIQNIFQSKGASNSRDYNNPEVDRLMDQAETVYDTAKAKVLYDQIQRLILEDVPFVPHTFPASYTVMTSKVQGFAQPPDLRLRMRNLWLTK